MTARALKDFINTITIKRTFFEEEKKGSEGDIQCRCRWFNLLSITNSGKSTHNNAVSHQTHFDTLFFHFPYTR